MSTFLETIVSFFKDFYKNILIYFLNEGGEVYLFI